MSTQFVKAFLFQTIQFIQAVIKNIKSNSEVTNELDYEWI